MPPSCGEGVGPARVHTGLWGTRQTPKSIGQRTHSYGLDVRTDKKRIGMGHGENVIEELTTDHQEVDSLFEQIQALPAGDVQRHLADGGATLCGWRSRSCGQGAR